MTENDKKEGDRADAEAEKREVLDLSKLSMAELDELLDSIGNDKTMQEAVRRQKAAQNKNSRDRGR